MVLKAVLNALATMTRQYNKLYGQLRNKDSSSTIRQVVQNIKSSLRLHLFLRLGKLRTLIAEEERRHSLSMGLRTSFNAQQPASGRAEQNRIPMHKNLAASSSFIDLTFGRGEPRCNSMFPSTGKPTPTPTAVPPVTDGEEIVLLSDDDEVDVNKSQTNNDENVVNSLMDNGCVCSPEQPSKTTNEETAKIESRRSKRKKTTPEPVRPNSKTSLCATEEAFEELTQARVAQSDKAEANETDFGRCDSQLKAGSAEVETCFSHSPILDPHTAPGSTPLLTIDPLWEEMAAAAASESTHNHAAVVVPSEAATCCAEAMNAKQPDWYGAFQHQAESVEDQRISSDSDVVYDTCALDKSCSTSDRRTKLSNSDNIVSTKTEDCSAVHVDREPLPKKSRLSS